MKILFDHQVFEVQKFGGISRYFTEVIEGINGRKSAKAALSLKYSNNEYIRHSSFNKSVHEFPRHSNRYLNRILKLVFANTNKRHSRRELRKEDFDIFHPTYYDDYFLSLIGEKPFVLTVYDMIHEIFPEYFSDNTSEQKRALVEKAAKIIAISECTKNDLIKIFGIPAEKIQVVHLANSLDARLPAQLGSRKLPGRYILFVGSRPYYKNFDFFIRAISPLLRDDPALRVICTGSPFSAKEGRFFDSLGVANQIEHRSVDDAGLRDLYRNAQVFVFPSLYEGFGLPVLEAFSCSCPALLSTGGSLPEIGGNGAVYFDPKDSQSLITSIGNILDNQELRKDLIKRGSNRLKSFSWEKTARETEAVYAQLV